MEVKQCWCYTPYEGFLMLAKLAEKRKLKIIDAYKGKGCTSVMIVPHGVYSFFGAPNWEKGSQVSLEEAINRLSLKLIPYTNFYFKCDSKEQEEFVDKLLKGKDRLANCHDITYPFTYAFYLSGFVNKLQSMDCWNPIVSFEEGVQRLMREGTYE